MIFLRYINHIKSYFFAELNGDNFYMKIIDLDEIYNYIFRFKGIFAFSHLQFDGVRAWTDGSGMEDPKKLE